MHVAMKIAVNLFFALKLTALSIGAICNFSFAGDLDAKNPDLLPGQTKVSGHIQQESTIGNHVFKVYHPENYRLEAVNLHLNRPRLIYFYGDVLFVGSASGRIYRLYPPYDQAQVISKLSLYPHSILIRDDEIIIARTHGVFRSPYTIDPNWRITEHDLKLLVPLQPTRSHSSRTIKKGPDGRLYVSIGMAGNCGDYYAHESYPPEKRLGGIFVIDESVQPAKLAPYAAGLRNPVGFDWHPETGVMYASNNGPDHLGYDQPKEYFSKVTEGSFHGMPWYQFDGESLFRDNCIETDAPQPIENVSIPAAVFLARNAPLDVAFVTSRANASEYYGDAIVALHGSWATKTGSYIGDPATRRHPKLARVKFIDGKAEEVIDLLSGFQLQNGQRWARPVGVAIGNDGDIYFTSDDEIQGLYRLRKIRHE